MSVIHAKNFTDEAAQLIAQHAEKAIEASGSFRLGLSGGNTPRAIYAKLAESYADLPWDKVIFTFGDDRQVPKDDPMSNYRMANESLFSKVAASEENVLRYRTELGHEAAANDYEERLRKIAAERGEAIYRHDLLLLGMGGDGHTASLFPGSPVLQEKQRWIGLQHMAPAPVTERITFTYPLINAARNICIMVGEAAKSAVVDEVMEGEPRHPTSFVRPTDGEVIWFLGY